MTPERAIEIFTVINFGVIGLSHVAQPRVWVEFFVILRAKGYVGVFVNSMLSLLVGSIIVSFHPSWSGIGAIVTFLGWAQVFKGLLSLVAPQVGMKGMMRVSMERAWEFQFAGALFLVMSAVIAWGWRTA
jgi:hypothetical protein